MIAHRNRPQGSTPGADRSLQFADGHRPQDDTAPFFIGEPVRLDLLPEEPLTEAEIRKTVIWLRHAHGWILKVPKWRVTGG